MFEAILVSLPDTGKASLVPEQGSPESAVDWFLHKASQADTKEAGIYKVAYWLFLEMTGEEMEWTEIKQAFVSLEKFIEETKGEE